MNYSVPSIVLLFAAFNAFAADPNGYNATYEIEIGTPPACDVTITSADSLFTIESALNNPLNTVICADAGDYTAKGKITITDSGSVGNEKWWRLSGLATKHPIDLMASERAIFETVGLKGNYWIIHRLYFDANGTSPGNFISGTNNILDRIVMEDVGGNNSRVLDIKDEAHNNTVQNSVIRNTAILNSDIHCISSGRVDNLRLVNNEVYNCAGDGYQLSAGAGYVLGLVIENNDIYLTRTYYSDGSGRLTPSGNYACAENGIDLKRGGDFESPARVIHNRIWGWRRTDGKCADGSAGEAVIIHHGRSPEHADYVLLKNNIIFDAPHGIGHPNGRPNNLSIIGNILWNLHDRTRPGGRALYPDSLANSELYLNTIIYVNSPFAISGGAINMDMRCNVFIDAGTFTGTSWGAGSKANYNAFYSTDPYTTERADHNMIFPTAIDARHVEYCLYRKRWTGPERVCIPNAQPTTSSPHFGQCDKNLGARTGIGINDKTISQR